MTIVPTKLRILLLAQFYPPIIGGEERHVRNLGAALAKRGHRVNVVTLWHPGTSEYERDGEVGVYRLRGTFQRISCLYADPGERRHVPPLPDPELVLGLRRLLERENPDIVHAHNWLLHSFLPLKGFSRARFLVTLHDYSLICPTKNFMHEGKPCDGPGILKCFACAGQYYGAIKGGMTTVANCVSSQFERQTVNRFLAVSRAVATFNRLERGRAAFDVVPNFVPDDIAKLSPEAPKCVKELPAEDFVLFVGDLTRLKGVHVLLEAYRRLVNAPPLVLIGRECRDTPNDLPPKVRRFQSWPHSAIMHAWSRSLFGVLPSICREACATVIMEAMALGKPMVATEIGGTPDLIHNGETGLLVTPGDPDALVAAMRTLLRNAELRNRLARACLEKVERMKASVIVSRIEEIYYELTCAHPVESSSEAKHQLSTSG